MLAPQGGTSISGGREGGLAPKFASESLVGAPYFASKNISDKYPKFCPLNSNFRYDPKIGTSPNSCVLWWQNFLSFSSCLVNLAGPCPKFCLQTWCEVQAPPPPRPPYLEVPPWGSLFQTRDPNLSLFLAFRLLCFHSGLFKYYSKL